MSSAHIRISRISNLCRGRDWEKEILLESGGTGELKKSQNGGDRKLTRELFNDGNNFSGWFYRLFFFLFFFFLKGRQLLHPQAIDPPLSTLPSKQPMKRHNLPSTKMLKPPLPHFGGISNKRKFQSDCYEWWMIYAKNMSVENRIVNKLSCTKRRKKPV